MNCTARYYRAWHLHETFVPGSATVSVASFVKLRADFSAGETPALPAESDHLCLPR